MKFEYKQEMIPPGDGLLRKLNDLGSEGWGYCFHLNLMMQSPLAPGPPSPMLAVFFKRVIPEPLPPGEGFD